MTITKKNNFGHATLQQVVTPAPRDVWKRLADGDPHAFGHQHPEIFDFFKSYHGYDNASRYYRFSDGQEIVVPLLQRKLFGVFPILFQTPDWEMCGVLSSSSLKAGYIKSIWTNLILLNVMQIRLRPNPLNYETWCNAGIKPCSSIPGKVHIIDLTGGYEAVAGRFSTMTRRLIKKAIKKNVTVEQDTHYRYVGELVELLGKSYKRWAEQQHEPIWLTLFRRQDNLKEDQFKALIDSIGAGCRIWIARLDGKPAAAALNLNHGNVVNVLMPMDKAVAGKSGAVDMLRNEMLKDACKKKKRYFNLGESGPSASLSFYKERVGGIPYHYCEFIYERIPLTRIDQLVRSMVKKMIGFKDTKDFSYGKNKKTSGLHQVIGK